MGLNSQDLIDRIASHAAATGYFDKVNQHEPKSKPGRGITGAVWIDRIEPARAQSGLISTSVRVVFNVRIYTNMLQQPQDAIDPNVMEAADVLFAAYTSDFTLGDDSRFIDLLGMTQGHELFCQSGYINIDNMVYRVLTLTVPVVVRDAWTQAP